MNNLTIYENEYWKKSFFDIFPIEQTIWIVISNTENKLYIYNYDTLTNTIIFFQKISTYCEKIKIIKHNDILLLLFTDLNNLNIYGFTNDKFNKLDFINEKSPIDNFNVFFINNMPTFIIQCDSTIKIYNSYNSHIAILPQKYTGSYITVNKNLLVNIYYCYEHLFYINQYNDKKIICKTIKMPNHDTLKYSIVEYEKNIYMVQHNDKKIVMYILVSENWEQLCDIENKNNICIKNIESLKIADNIIITTDSNIITIKNEELLVDVKLKYACNIENEKYVVTRNKINNAHNKLFKTNENMPMHKRQESLKNKIDLFLGVIVVEESHFTTAQKILFDSYKNVIKNNSNLLMKNFLLEKIISESFDSFFVNQFHSKSCIDIITPNKNINNCNNYINLVDYDGAIIIMGYVSPKEKNNFPHEFLSNDDLFVIRHNGINYFPKCEQLFNIDKYKIRFELIFTLVNMDTFATNPLHENIDAQFMGIFDNNDEIIFINNANENLILKKKINNTFINLTSNIVNIKYNMLFDFNDAEFTIDPATLLSHRILKDGTNISKNIMLNSAQYSDNDIIEMIYD